MYKKIGPAVDFGLDLKPLVANSTHCEVVIAPVFTALKTVSDRIWILYSVACKYHWGFSKACFTKVLFSVISNPLLYLTSCLTLTQQ